MASSSMHSAPSAIFCVQGGDALNQAAKICAGCAQCAPAARPTHQPTSAKPPTHLRVVQDGWDGDGRHRAEAHQELARVLPAAGQVAAAGAAAEEQVGLV